MRAAKRIGGGLLLLFLAAALLSASAAMARSAGAPTGSFEAPARLPGDHGVYNVTRAPFEDGAGGEPDRIFATLAAQSANAADGHAYVTMPLREAWLVADKGDFHERWRVAFDEDLEPVSAERLVARNLWSGGHCAPTGMVPCALVSVNENALYRIETDQSRTVYGEDGGLCGLRNEAQGQRVLLGKPVRFLGDCATPRLHAIRETSLPGHDHVVVFSGRSGDRVSQVWLGDGVPYPLRVWDGQADGNGTAYTLSAWQPGADGPAVAPGASLPMPGTRGRTDLGPDASGVLLPWSLQAAVDAAKALAGSSLAAYLQQHPEAALASAGFTEVTNGHWRQRTWTLQYTGAESAGFAIHFDQPEDGEPAATAPFYSKDPSAAADGDFYVTSFDAATDLPPPAAMPTHLPAVADVARIYDQVRPSRDADWDLNGWSFSVTCPAPCASASDTVFWVAAGHTRVISDQAGATQRFGVPELQPIVETHVLFVAAEADRLRSIERVDQVRSPYTDSLPSEAASSPGWALASRASAFAWDDPGPLLAAGTGLALAIAAIVLLADALRHGGAGLFSRIQPATLPEHPVRAGLLAAIEASPGVHFSELSRRLDVAAGVAQHHLRKLTDAGLVQAVPAGAHTRYFMAGTTRAMTVEAHAFGTAGAAEVLSAVRGRPGISVSQLAAATGRSVGTVSHHLDRLQEAGLVDRRREGRRVGVYPSAAGMTTTGEADGGQRAF